MSTDHDDRASTAGPVTVPLAGRGSGPGERGTNEGGGPPLR
ncbi:hypothetical protein HNP84_005977 [Thermocatellispora tengchongensis]|uniref:Uncharacterized protein n=1 Tax=Thermocatellispora tengchongensis TaxID=1073253 RepID=A0A840PE68_9ACTN|nr:hypothetical protein [Thermocatellispora tengchongensis]MBB5136233.1 hypothetical protein [Thermocatellispora tengchongensis]